VCPRTYCLFPVALAFVLLAAMLLQGCSIVRTNDAPATSEQAVTQPVEEEKPLYVATYQPNGNEIAVITTDKGVIRFKFYPDEAPNHVASFIELALQGFYDGTKFHRVEPGFVIQGGDPLSKTDNPRVGTGGPGYFLAAEFSGLQHLDGTVSMARAQDPNSAGSQFFICLGPQPFLDGQYTVFGQVIEGMDVVRAIEPGDVKRSVTIENANQQ